MKTTFDDFKKCNQLAMANYQTILPFYQAKYSNDLPPFYHALPEYNSILGNGSYRYEIETVGEDKVLVVFNIIQIVKTKQVRLIGQPISISRNIENEKAVLEMYLRLPFVKAVVLSAEMPDFSAIENYDDYFIDLSKKAFTPKYKHDYGINKITRGTDYRVEWWTGKKLFMDYTSLVALKDAWVTGMIDRGSTVTAGFSANFMKLLLSDSKNLKKCVLWYKDTPLLMFIALCDDNIGAQALLQIIHIGRDAQIEGVSKMVSHSLSEIRAWILAEMYNQGVLKFPKLYIAGCRPGEERLLNHKIRMSDGCIKYGISE